VINSKECHFNFERTLFDQSTSSRLEVSISELLKQLDLSSKTFNREWKTSYVHWTNWSFFFIKIFSPLTFQENSNRILIALGFTKRFVYHALRIKWIIINSCFVTTKVAKLDLSEQVLNYLLFKIFQENVFKIEINFFFLFPDVDRSKHQKLLSPAGHTFHYRSGISFRNRRNS